MKSHIATVSAELQERIDKAVADSQKVGKGAIAEALVAEAEQLKKRQTGLVLSVRSAVNDKLEEKVKAIREIRKAKNILASDIGKLDTAMTAFMTEGSEVQGDIPVLEEALKGLVDLSRL